MNNPVKVSFLRIFGELRNILRFVKRVIFKITHLADDTDVEGTIKDIKGGVVLEGSNLWVLICSAAIACIGLDTNSPAVIIGAMLISPLMSPILGIGLSVGINDKEYLIKSVYNFGVATGLSLLTAFIYFKLTPLGDITDEMRSRVQPTLLDAGVALFGGLAGIIAGSRTEKSNAIPGVAIATALMPPVCTAGFGLANGQFQIFGGAFYLFFINAVLISLSTYVVVRMLRFPLAEDEDPEWAPRIKGFIAVAVIVVLTPSIFFLLNTINKIRQNEVISSFISKHIHEDMTKGVEWNFNILTDSTAELEVYYFGAGISQDSTDKLTDTLSTALTAVRLGPEYKYYLDLTPTDAPPETDEKDIHMANTIDRLGDDIRKHRVKLEEQEYLTDSLFKLFEEVETDTIPFEAIKTELKALYPELEELLLGSLTQTDFDTTGNQEYLTAVLKWNKKLYSSRVKRQRQERIAEYLKVKLKADTVGVVTR
ncbi:MAG: DUF389 domain-containing protein [Flammeovirgaceae bacterium]